VGASVGVAACIALYWYYRSRSRKWKNLQSITGGVPEGPLVQAVNNYTAEVTVPDEAVGYVIGRDGQNLKQIRSQVGVRVSFKQLDGGGQVAVISGKRDSVDQAKSMIQKQIKEKLTVKKVETFSMQVPQFSVGRIIGKQGKSIRELCRLSGARVVVEKGREYDLLSQRMCTITGTAEQIARAKSMIEEKIAEENEFRRKRGSAQETKTTRGGGILPPHIAEVVTVDMKALSPRLPSTDDYFSVYVSAVEVPDHFWVQSLELDGSKLDALAREMNAVYPCLGADELSVENVVVGDIVCALFRHDSSWYRARVEEVISDTEIEVHFVDFGDNDRITYQQIKKLRSEFLQLPFQAVECGLHGIKPKGNVYWELRLFMILQNLGNVSACDAVAIVFSVIDTHLSHEECSKVVVLFSFPIFFLFLLLFVSVLELKVESL
jgi:tudor domain-containing protein 2